jgi:hypothetical protein
MHLNDGVPDFVLLNRLLANHKLVFNWDVPASSLLSA